MKDFLTVEALFDTNTKMTENQKAVGIFILTAFCLFKYSNLKFLKYPSKARGFGDSAMELGDRHALLLGAVAMTDGDGVVF